ncbi:MAG: HAMP domain-containing protein [Spirochaetales bacterium]|jgi:class 3 adenylate cyclase/HAMP domain-containing protein|nr:HAMP domain-containing protein [Spirochaetales bacterium]
MTIRLKIIVVVLPLIIVTLVLAGTASYFAGTQGITRVAQEFLGFKASTLEKYTESQWNLLVENGFSEREDMIEVAKGAIAYYAQGMLLSDTEIIFALDSRLAVVMTTSEDFSVLPEEQEELAVVVQENDGSILAFTAGGGERVARSFYFAPFGWHIFLTEEKAAFYSDVKAITTQTIFMIAGACAAAVLLLFFFANILTRPLVRVVEAMNGIIHSGDMASRVEVEFSDETGRLAQTFNIMINELDRAYREIKRYAFDAVLAQKKEQRIRQIFQKYVPKDLIDKFFAAPESMLVGDNRMLAVLFSDIRGFTAISENMPPDEVVSSLNRYFSGQVDIIMNRSGIVDKYIGDAIMAFWGAPIQHDDDALQAVLSAFDMLDALKEFNRHQKKAGKPEFTIGIGINYGIVTVGNIGSERKMDYTVIGDMVNLASRMEGLTKIYREEILISESIYAELQGKFPARLLDTAAVKGKTQGVKIYTVKRKLTAEEKRAWNHHNGGMEFYYNREFDKAAAKFRKVLEILPRDFNAGNLLARCRVYALNPPPEDWDGVEVMQVK